MNGVRCFALVACMTTGLARTAESQLPLDPLTRAESTAAQRATREDPRVRELVGQRRSVIGTTYFVAIKADTAGGRLDARREPPPIRAAMVVYYVYDGDYGVQALVDLRRSAVIAVERLQNQPIPFAAEEVAEARQLALRDERVRAAVGAEALRQQRIEWLPINAIDERDPCYKHRCVQLMFRRGLALLMRPTVIVDLTTRQVRLEEPPR